MPRRARITVAGVPHHVVQRGHNREAIFFADEDYLAYLHSLSAIGTGVDFFLTN